MNEKIEVYGVDHSDPTKPGRVLMYLDQHERIVAALKAKKNKRLLKAIKKVLEKRE
jgi:DNA-binding FadR family transcriptional regulator